MDDPGVTEPQHLRRSSNEFSSVSCLSGATITQALRPSSSSAPRDAQSERAIDVAMRGLGRFRWGVMRAR
jgi:hypothetical protein